MVSKYYKIGLKSPGNNSFKSFQLYLYVCCLFSNLLTYQIYELREIFLHKGEKSLSAEMEINFTELLLSERMKNLRKSLGQVIVCSRKIQRSLSRDFSPQTPWMILSGKQDHGNSGKNCGHIISRASLLRRPICTYPSSGFSFEPIIGNAGSLSLITTEKQCRRFITLIYHDNI